MKSVVSKDTQNAKKQHGASTGARTNPHQLLQLQKQFGNQATMKLIQRQVIQRVSEDIREKYEALVQAASAGTNKEQTLLEVRELLRIVCRLDKKADPEVGPFIGKINLLIRQLEDSGKKKDGEEVKPKFGVPKEHRQTAELLHRASTELLHRAKRIEERQSTMVLVPDAVEKVETRPSAPKVIPVYESYPSPDEHGLGVWTGLLQSLRSFTGDPMSVRRIIFQTIDGETITINMSHHSSSYVNAEDKRKKITRQEPDYLVHDTRAVLAENSSMGIVGNAPGDHQLDPDDTLDVSYAAFTKKIGAMKVQLGVTDSQIASWMLMVIMSPSIAKVAIEREAEVTPDHLNIIYELVSAWMLAEPVRHAGSMVSGVMELELIEAGERSFAESLADSKETGHPMAHVGSESQGRDASALVNGRGGVHNTNAVLKKQHDQMQASFGDNNQEAQVVELVNFYTRVVEQALSQAKQEAQTL